MTLAFTAGLDKVAAFLIEYGTNSKMKRRGLSSVSIATTQRKENVYHIFRLLYADGDWIKVELFLDCFK